MRLNECLIYTHADVAPLWMSFQGENKKITISAKSFPDAYPHADPEIEGTPSVPAQS